MTDKPCIKFYVRARVQGPNAREHYMARARRVSGERAAVHGCSLVQLGPDWRRGLKAPYAIKLTRIGKRLMDDDNVAAACKGVRDEVAVMLGHGDGPRDPITWSYGQAVADKYAVLVEIWHSG